MDYNQVKDQFIFFERFRFVIGLLATILTIATIVFFFTHQFLFFFVALFGVGLLYLVELSLRENSRRLLKLMERLAPRS